MRRFLLYRPPGGLPGWFVVLVLLLNLVALLFATFAAAEPEAQPAPAPAPRVVEMVPRAKLIKAVRARDEARADARRIRQVLAHDPTVEEALTIAAVAYGVPLSEMRSAARCESTFNPAARNGRYRGLFQFGPIFEASPFGHAGLSVWSPFASAMAAAYIVRHGGRGWSPWECSPHGAFRP